MIPFDVMRLIDMNVLCARPEMAANVPRNELRGERARAAACLAAIDSVIASAPEPVEVVEDRLLTVSQAVEIFPGVVNRRWLFEHDSLPFIRRLSRKRLAISEAGLRRYLAVGRKH